MEFHFKYLIDAETIQLFLCSPVTDPEHFCSLHCICYPVVSQFIGRHKKIEFLCFFKQLLRHANHESSLSKADKAGNLFYIPHLVHERTDFDVADIFDSPYRQVVKYAAVDKTVLSKLYRRKE